METWKLEWFYFGDLEVLYEEGPGCNPPGAQHAYERFGQALVDAADQAIANPRWLRDERSKERHDQDGPLIGLARTVVAESNRRGYHWPADKAWPLEIRYYDAKTHQMTSPHLAVLDGKDVCCLPWPLPVLTKKASDGQINALTSILGVELLSPLPKNAIDLRTLFTCYDEAYAENTNPNERKTFRGLTSDPGLRSALRNKLPPNGKLSMPGASTFCMHTASGMDTDETHVRRSNNGLNNPTILRFVMGLENPPAAYKPPPPQGVTMSAQEYPCGGFQWVRKRA